MVEKKNFTLDLHIKTLSLKVSEHTSVHVVWSRGQKKAKTNSKQLNEHVSTVVIEEKFQINTEIEVDADGHPIKEKMSKIAIEAKNKGILGEADLNLCEYGEGDYKILKLSLKKCEDPNAFIEIGLRATPVKVKKSKDKLPSSSSQVQDPNETQITEEVQQKINKLKAQLEQEKKALKQQKIDYEAKVKKLNKNYNALGTQLENFKNQLSQIDKKKKDIDKDVENMEEQKKVLASNLDKKNKDIEDKNKEIDKLKHQMHELEKQLDQIFFENKERCEQKEKEMKDILNEVEKIKADKRKYYEFERFDIDYLSSVSRLFKGDGKTQTAQ